MTNEEEPLCVSVLAADLFERPDFQEWLNRYVGKGLATWHGGGEPGDYSDVFVLFDHDEGPESPSGGTPMPQACWDIIKEFCKKEGVEYALLWLKNLEG